MNYYNWIIPIIGTILLGGLYLGIHLRPLFSKKHPRLFWILLYLLITALLLLRNIFIIFGFYLIFFYLITDLLSFICKKTNQEKRFSKWYQKGISVILISLIITIYGVINANIITTKYYNVSIDHLKTNSKIAVISDIHLKNTRQLDEILKKVNRENVDFIFFVGDIFDEYTTASLKDYAYDIFKKFKSNYGMYFVEGNHDLLNFDTREKLQDCNIMLLEDQTIKINQRFNLIGRKDYRNNILGNPRKSLEELVKEIDPTLPTILLDHQPKEEQFAKDLKIDLQISGHTHAGQIFSGNLFLEYGYKKNGNYQKIVSAGAGVWAVPVRTAKHNELVIIQMMHQ